MLNKHTIDTNLTFDNELFNPTIIVIAQKTLS